MKRVIISVIVLAVSVSMFSCAITSHKQQGLATGSIIGAIGGAILGQVIGGDTEATLIGTGIGTAIGALAGHQIGRYMDNQEQELRSAMAGSEAAAIQREHDVLSATFKSDVFFDFDSSSLKPGAYPELSRVAGILNKYSQTNIRIEGHTDSRGPEDYNRILSEKRAESVKNALVQNGVYPLRIQSAGFGESQPISTNDALNRRVTIVIIPI